MRGRQLAVVFVALLLVSAVPAHVEAASGTLVVGSQHTDFGTGDETAPQTLENLTVSGSGDDASVTLDNGTVYEGFEDGDASEWTATSGSISVTSSNPISGAYSGVLDGSDGTDDAATRSVPETTSTTNLSFTLRLDSLPSGSLPIDYRTNGTYGPSVGIQSDGDFYWYDGQTHVVDTLSANTEYTITIRPDFAAHTYDLYVNGELVASDANFGNDINSISTVKVSSVGSRVLYDDFRKGPSTVDSAQYVSATHEVSNAKEAAINITQLSNVSVEAEVRTDGGTVLGSDTITSTGNHTVSLTNTSSSQVETVLDVEVTGENPQFELADESILFDNDAPTVDNSSASPTGELSQQELDLSIDVNDSQFGTAQGEELTATFYVDGESVGTDTATSNGTVSVTYQATEGGSHNWSVTVEDSYGATTTSDTFSFSAPSEIAFRKESNPDQLVDEVNVQVTAYYSGEVQKRNVTNGKLNLTGFPIDEPIIIRANASGYYKRTVVIESVYGQTNMFLLNDNQSAYLVRFELQDLAGNYPKSDSVLIVERDLTLNNSTEWRAIVGDNFGVAGVPANLKEDERYRLRIKNLETGETAVIGGYTAIQDETVTLSTGSAEITIPDSEKEYGYAATKDRDTDTIHFRYTDDANQTQKVKLTIHERFNKSNVLVDNATFTDSNDISYQKSLTANETNKTWMAEIYVDRGDGWMHFRTAVGGGSISIVPADLDSVWVSSIGVFLMLVSAMAFSELNVGVGAIATSLTGGILWWFGLLEGVAIGPVIVVAIMLAVVWHYYRTPQGGVA